MIGSLERARQVGWLSAVVLLVLLAAAGMPASPHRHGPDARTELGVERSERGGVSVAELVARAVHAPAPVGVAPVPRARPRTRSVSDRGLPPPRAPTC